MIFGSLSVDHQAVHTHRNSYLLDTLTVIAVHRPLLPLGAVMALGVGGFGLAFHNILYGHELGLIFVICLLAVTIGWSLGQLQLISRDLRGTEQMGAVFGSYQHLNALRHEIVAAKRGDEVREERS